jgi:uncharacterized membrane protein
MIDILNTLLYWVHTIASVYWIGGIAFIVLILIPKTKQILGKEAGKLIGAISKTFKLHVDISIIILILTGIALSMVNAPVQIEQVDNWRILLIAKHILVAIMIFIHIYRNTILSKRINKENEISKKSSLQKLSLNLVKVVLIIGLIVLLLSIMASKL